MGRAVLPLKSPGERILSCSTSSRWLPVFLGLWLHHSSLWPPHLLPLSPLSYKDTCPLSPQALQVLAASLTVLLSLHL